MKIFKSIKWRLQIWYGLILVAVLVGFGVTAYQLERSRQFRRVDEELQRRFGGLANALHRPQRPSNFDQPPFNRRPPDPNFDDGPPGPNRPPREFHLPPEMEVLFGTNQPNNFYFLIKDRRMEKLAQSDNLPSSQPETTAGINSPRENRPPLLRPQKLPVNWKNFREINQELPSGERIFVGCSVAPELHELKMTALKLSGVGGIILLFGLLGGGWLVGRALRPIQNISATATKISAGDLSQRINIAEAESELGQLAAVLNSTFARLDAAFAQQKQFASDAAHELRTPVSVILTQAQLSLNRERDAASYRQTVEACQRAAQRMRKLIESLLALARLDAGQEVLKRLRFDFAKTISDCAELVKPMAEEQGVNIICELTPLEMSGDSERLAQVVINLLTNAIQYNLREGEVRVKLEPQDGLAVLTVADTGAGIAAEDLPRVFERFYRGDKSRTGAGNAGLGLAISKAIVEAHGGTMEVTSEENVGTTFIVRLPVGNV